ncbi:MAG: type II toxin-antitoxin system HicA family toxin [Bacteroidia bacterium]|jgi:predicted RNA binding protein YcfA (HicA-like mRNA interferase family)|nr:type II toxin-antitoxin system HicA family toxin [Bacteroidia bacterium]
MGNNRPLDTKCWISLLKHLGFVHSRTSGSHYSYTRPGYRTIPVWGNEKQIPAMHLRTGARTLGWDLADVYKWAEANC